MTLKAIGQRVGVTSQRARQIIALDIIDHQSRSGSPFTNDPHNGAEYHSQMIQMRKEGYFLQEIADELGLSWLTVQRHLSALGMGVGKGRRSTYSAEQKAAIISAAREVLPAGSWPEILATAQRHGFKHSLTYLRTWILGKNKT